MKTLAGIRTGSAEGLVGRAADVVVKERRKLVLVPRETPLSEIHLENTLALTRMGAVMVPPTPAFGIEAPVDTPRWVGLAGAAPRSTRHVLP